MCTALGVMSLSDCIPVGACVCTCLYAICRLATRLEDVKARVEQETAQRVRMEMEEELKNKAPAKKDQKSVLLRLLGELDASADSDPAMASLLCRVLREALGSPWRRPLHQAQV